jgi:hypothetical protein
MLMASSRLFHCPPCALYQLGSIAAEVIQEMLVPLLARAAPDGIYFIAC